MSSKARARLALTLAGIAALGAAMLVTPSLHRTHWIARLMLRETSLALVPIALVSLSLAWRSPEPASRLARGISLLALLIACGAFALPLAAFPRLREFSPAEYVLAGLLTPRVRVEQDLLLDAARPALSSDVFHAAGPGPHPFVVLVHGGSWRGGDKREAPHFSRQLAGAGYSVVEVRYGLAPRDPFPRGVADVKCLLGRLRERAGALGIDPARGALLGRSAGGQVALIAAYSSGDPSIRPSCSVPDEPVRSVVAFYAPSDLAWGHENPMVPDIVRGTESLELYLGGAPKQAAEAYRLATPASWVDRALPPTLLIHGSGDQIVGLIHSERLAEALHRRGHSVSLMKVPLGEHGFEARPGGVGEQMARRRVIEFLGATLGLNDLSRSRRPPS